MVDAFCFDPAFGTVRNSSQTISPSFSRRAIVISTVEVFPFGSVVVCSHVAYVPGFVPVNQAFFSFAKSACAAPADRVRRRPRARAVLLIRETLLAAIIAGNRTAFSAGPEASGRTGAGAAFRGDPSGAPPRPAIRATGR